MDELAGVLSGVPIAHAWSREPPDSEAGVECGTLELSHIAQAESEQEAGLTSPQQDPEIRPDLNTNLKLYRVNCLERAREEPLRKLTGLDELSGYDLLI